ncbi:MAG: acetyl-CoA carboxylase biotin carboxyl carrier protein subunit [Prevotellaceae bacterium]|jgi:biotin carboxyl carrier protein|nr:acetyl-CoA carboxylase biotin carboxyl carrier protein subunit [Prevotellaceae bacterium]
MKKYKFTINGTDYSVEIKNVEGQSIELDVDGAPYSVLLETEMPQTKTPTLIRSVAVPSTDQGAQVKATSKTGTIKSPLPGTILDIFVKTGDKVAIGQRILLLEAMKMENNIESDKAGTVAEIKISKGDAVMEGDVLLVIGE